MKRMSLAVALACASGLFPVTGAMAQTSGEPIVIGAVIPATGGGAGIGKSQLQGALLAEKEINKAGGIKGRPIKIIVGSPGTELEFAL